MLKTSQKKQKRPVLKKLIKPEPQKVVKPECDRNVVKKFAYAQYEDLGEKQDSTN